MLNRNNNKKGEKLKFKIYIYPGRMGRLGDMTVFYKLEFQPSSWPMFIPKLRLFPLCQSGSLLGPQPAWAPSMQNSNQFGYEAQEHTVIG